MEKRMNRNELIALIKTLKISKSNFWVLSSGALVLRGIYPDAGDLDIAVNDRGLKELKQNYNLIAKPNSNFYKVTENIECVCDGPKSKLKYKPEKVGDFYVQNIYEYLDYLKSSNREKDKKRIPIVEEYIKNKNLKKMEWEYDDTVDYIYGAYRIQKPDNNRIKLINDILCNEEMDGFFDKNPINEFETILAFCYNMIQYKVYDKFFFDKYLELVQSYKNGEYDNYLFDKEKDKKQIDEHIKIVEEYIRSKK